MRKGPKISTTAAAMAAANPIEVIALPPSFAKSSYEYHKCVLYTFPSEGINDFIHPHSMGTLEENRISRS